MEVEGTARIGFVHGHITGKKGKPVKAPIETMRKLAKARLVDWKENASSAPAPAPGPSEAGGEQSSASPAVPASPQTTAKKSEGGKKKTRKTAE